MALFGYGFVHTNERPDEVYLILRRGLKLAQDSGNRQYESHFALGLSRLAVTQGEPIDALDFLTVAIRNHRVSWGLVRTSRTDRAGRDRIRFRRNPLRTRNSARNGRRGQSRPPCTR